MSIKIHGGRIIRASIGHVYRHLMEIKPQVEEIGRQLEVERMTRQAVMAIDTAILNDETPPGFALFDAWSGLLDDIKEIKTTERRNPRSDFGFELWLFPVSDRRTLVMTHTEQERMTKWFDGQECVEEYGYWDNTDREENVSAREWRRRRDDWMKVLPWGGAASDRCLTFMMHNPERPMIAKAEEALPFVEPLDRRVGEHAFNRHIGEIYKMLVEREREKDPDFKPRGFEHYFEAERMARGDTARREEIRREIAAKLHEITLEDLSPRQKE